MADTAETKAFYVSMIDGKRYSLLAGPFATHQEALDRVGDAKRIAIDLVSWAVFYAFGTMSITGTKEKPIGKLNAHLGL